MSYNLYLSTAGYWRDVIHTPNTPFVTFNQAKQHTCQWLEQTLCDIKTDQFQLQSDNVIGDLLGGHSDGLLRMWSVAKSYINAGWTFPVNTGYWIRYIGVNTSFYIPDKHTESFVFYKVVLFESTDKWHQETVILLINFTGRWLCLHRVNNKWIQVDLKNRFCITGHAVLWLAISNMREFPRSAISTSGIRTESCLTDIHRGC